MTTSPLESAVRGVHLGLLWGASLLVPAWKRSEWSQEWRTELWYVLRKCLSETSLDPDPFGKPLHSAWERTAMQFGSGSDHGKRRSRSHKSVVRLLRAFSY